MENNKTVRTPEEQRTRLLEYKDFNLVKVKIIKKYADVLHHEEGADAGSVTKQGETVPHPDLQKSLDKLKPLMARRLGFLEGTDLAKKLLQGVDLDKYKEVMDLEKLIISRMHIGGLTFNGKGDKFGVMITGSFTTPVSGSVGLATPRIAFEEDVLGYEDECFELCEEVKKEVHAYRFLNKKAQLDIVFESEKIEEEEKEAKKAEKPEKQTDKPKTREEVERALFKDQKEEI